jgi:hypothetical protein
MNDIAPRQATSARAAEAAPVRGPLSLTPSAGSPQITAGEDFSIFVTLQNPFDVPVALYEVQTHLPVELVDINQVLLLKAEDQNLAKPGIFGPLRRWLWFRRQVSSAQTGYATAVGTGYSPEKTKSFLESRVTIKTVAEGAVVEGIAIHLPEKATPDELDAFMRRISSYQDGVVPLTLAPGDQVVQQFRLRTRRWLFFTPLAHTFQIQANFAVDNADHHCSIPFPVAIRSKLASIIIGGLVGALLGSVLKVFTDWGDASWSTFSRGALIAILATLAVVIGFARKTGNQSFVSVEDAWGGMLIGFSVAFVGYEQFVSVLGP